MQRQLAVTLCPLGFVVETQAADDIALVKVVSCSKTDERRLKSRSNYLWLVYE